MPQGLEIAKGRTNRNCGDGVHGDGDGMKKRFLADGLGNIGVVFGGNWYIGCSLKHSKT